MVVELQVGLQRASVTGQEVQGGGAATGLQWLTKRERRKGGSKPRRHRGFSENFVADVACCALANEHREESKTSTGRAPASSEEKEGQGLSSGCCIGHRRESTGNENDDYRIRDVSRHHLGVSQIRETLPQPTRHRPNSGNRHDGDGRKRSGKQVDRQQGLQG